MILVYTEKVTNRVRYIFDLIFSGLMGCEFRFTQDAEEFNNFIGARFSYGQEPVGNEIFFKAHKLLYERGIQSPELEFREFKGQKVFFSVHHNHSALPFDPFAASFYLVTRYEEYLPYVRDEFGRFRAEKSLSYELGLIREPLVNRWAAEIASVLRERYPSFDCVTPGYSFIPTIDMDAAWLFRSKGLIRSMGGLLRTLQHLDVREFRRYVKVLLGLEADPLDNYDRQIELIKKHRLPLIYFILFGAYDTNDKNISVHNRNFQVLIKTLADYARVGIHSSFNSSFAKDRLRHELHRLSFVLKREITVARQHFTRLNMPETYRNYLNNGILEDYSMGYMHRPGFRAGICSPFLFYDLDMDQVTKLRVTPFSFAFTSTDERSEAEKISDLKGIVEVVRKYGGTLQVVWENAALRDDKSDWYATFEEVIRLAGLKEERAPVGNRVG